MSIVDEHLALSTRLHVGIEHAIDRVWEGISGDDSIGDGYEIYILDVELPRPVRHPPVLTQASRVAPAVRVDSKESVLRGRSEALERVLQLRTLDQRTAQKIRLMLDDVDDDWPMGDGADISD